MTYFRDHFCESGGGVEIGTGGHRNRYRGMVTLDRASDPELSNSDNA